MSCSVCRKPEAAEQRLAWGCDGPTAASPLRIYCWVCEGHDPDCVLLCRGGEILERRCPHSILQPEHWDAVRAATLLELGLLPTSRGWDEHPNSLMQAVSIVSRERARQEELRRK